MYRLGRATKCRYDTLVFFPWYHTMELFTPQKAGYDTMFFALFSQCRSKRKLELQRRTHRKWRILHHTLEPSLSCTIEFKKLLKILLLILYSYLFFTLYSILQSIWNELIYFFIHSLEVVQVKT